MLAFYLQGDINAIDTAFRGSALYRQKWERTDYREATISNAIALCGGEYYKGRGRPRKEPQKDDTDDLFTPEVLSNYLTENGVTVRLNDVTQSIDIEGMQGESQERFHLLMNEYNLTIKQLSYASDLSEETIKAILYSRVKDIKLSTAIKLANALNCSLDDLVQRK